MSEPPPSTHLDERFLVLAPTGRDAALTCRLLQEAGLECVPCRDMAELCGRYERGAAALLVAEEALDPASLQDLCARLDGQESWSDLPIVVFTARTARESTRVRHERLLSALGNVTLLDRPTRRLAVLGAARAALRARRRQYDARTAIEREQRAVEHRDQFLAMLGHELRNPLGAIVLAAELMAQRGLSGELGKHTEMIQRQAHHLRRLVDDLLDVSRVTSGKIVLARVRVDLCELVERCLDGLGPSLSAHGLTATSELPAERVVVLGDAVRLEQVLVNLLTNAIKYTPAGGWVRVTVAAEENEAVLCVHDAGAGIAAPMLEHIFDLFAQLDTTLDRSRGGLGLGLTLVRHLVEAHGGAIEASSPGPGRGATFTIRLPLPAFTSDAEVEATAVGSSGERAGYRVLVVEDHEDSRELLQQILEIGGHQVDAVGDGRAGVEQALRARPDVMVVDIGLPELDGYGVAREVRRALGDSVFLVALTGYSQPQDKRLASEAGFDMHFTKPADSAALLGLLQRDDLVAQPTPQPPSGR